MLQKNLAVIRAPRGLASDFPNMGQTGGCLCARRIGMATQDVSDERVEVAADDCQQVEGDDQDDGVRDSA